MIQGVRYKNLNRLRLSPPRTLALGFLIMIVLGALLLMLPISTYPGKRLNVIDALFEATSAVCVTGLVVTDTGTTFTLFGKTILLLLIQIGGLGFMTFGILIAVLLGKKIGLSDRLIVQSAFNQLTLSGLVKLVKLIIAATLIIELSGALILTVIWAGEMGFAKAFYFGLFHSVSSFNNAGFDLMGDYQSLTEYVGNIPVNIVISSLYIIGGLGFTVLLEATGKQHIRKWSLHTKLVLLSTLILNMAACLLFFFFEYSNPATLGSLSMEDKMIAAYFHGTAPRSSGFNTLDLTQLNSNSVLLTMLLMFIGGSTGGTAGGIKITTFLLLILVVWNFISRKEDINIMRRRIPNELVFKALSISMIGIIIIFCAVFLLEISEASIPLMNLAFEAVSAFGTVGFTLGVTTELSVFGKLLIMALMFIGRLGPLTVAFALTKEQKSANYQYPEEKILIG